METCYYGHEDKWNDWTDKLDEQTTIRFPAVARYEVGDEFIGREERRLDTLICERIRRFCGEKDTLLYSFWICVLQIMLYKYDRKSRATIISPQIGHS